MNSICLISLSSLSMLFSSFTKFVGYKKYLILYIINKISSEQKGSEFWSKLINLLTILISY